MINRFLNNSLKGYFTKMYDGGINMIDANYAELNEYSNSYVIFEGDDAVIIEPCTFRVVPTLLECVKEKVPVENVKYIIPTHVHLDHASSTHILANIFPNATVLGHPKTCRFLEDPMPLIKGAGQIYGEDEVKYLYGDVEAVNGNRIKEIEDGEKILIGEARELSFQYTLGHSTHHLVIHDSLTNGVFSGDSFGMNYPRFGRDYILPSTSPIDFDPIEMKKSVEDIMTVFQPDLIYLTHFGVWEDPSYARDLNHFSIDLTVEKLVKCVPDQLTKLEKMYDGDEMMVEKKLLEWGVEITWEIMEEITGAPRSEMENYRPTKADSFLNALGSIVYVKRTLKKFGELPEFS